MTKAFRRGKLGELATRQEATRHELGRQTSKTTELSTLIEQHRRTCPMYLKSLSSNHDALNFHASHHQIGTAADPSAAEAFSKILDLETMQRRL